MRRFWLSTFASSAALVLMGCSAATQASFVPHLDLGVRSSRSRDTYTDFPSSRGKQRWDLTVFAQLAWSSRRSATLIASRNELSPDAWIEPCPDQDCFWDNPEDDSSSSSESAP